MSAVQAGVLEKLNDLVPGQIGDGLRWETAFVESLITLASQIAWERIGMNHGSEVIDLVADQYEYDLDTKFITVDRVEYSSIGGVSPEYDDYLEASTLNHFDGISPSWRNTGGVRPEYYALLSAPGTPNSQIFVYPSLSAVGDEKIRVTGKVIGTSLTGVSDDVQDQFIVPYVLGLMYVNKSQELGRRYMAQANAGRHELEVKYTNEYAGGVGSERGGVR